MKKFINELHCLLPEKQLAPQKVDNKASVSIIINTLSDPSESRILFIKRAENISDPWSGHIAFPGGRNELGETLQETAERESLEEVGLNLGQQMYLGALKPHCPRSKIKKLQIFPFVYHHSDPKDLLHDPKEVMFPFWIPLKKMFLKDHFAYKTFKIYKVPMKLPCFMHEEHIIWGVTYVIMTELLKNISQTTAGKSLLGKTIPSEIWPIRPY